MKQLLTASVATLALALAACSDPSEAYTPVDDLPSADDPATTTDPAYPPPLPPADDVRDGDPVDGIDPMDPAPVPVDPEVPPPMDPVPPVDDATRPPPVDPTMDDEGDTAPPTP